MKILYTLNSGQPGGMEYHTLDLAKGMISHGHEVYVWCMAGPLADWFEQAGAKVTRMEVRVKFGIDIDPLYIAKLIKFLKKNQIEIIHSHELRAVANSLIAGNLAGTRIRISHIHTPLSMWPISNLKKKIYTFFYSWSVKLLSTREIALTQSIKQVKVCEGIPGQKIAVIPNGFQSEKFNPDTCDKTLLKNEMSRKYKFPNDRFIFGNLSRLSQNKGSDILIRAFDVLLKQNPNLSNKVYLLLAGKGEQQEEVLALVHKLRLENNVCITGTFPDEDHIKLYSSLDAYVFPTLSEGFGLVLIEALAMKIPVICSDLEVLKEVGRDYVFEYFQTGSVDAIYNSMLSIYNDYDRAYQKVETARDFVTNEYSMEKFIASYESLYKTL